MTARFLYALAGCVTALAISLPAPAQAACTANDVAGSYESSYDKINCTASGNSLNCCYYSGCRYDLNLEVSADGTQAAGIWDHKTGRTGRVSFGVDAQCGLTNGLWGEGDAEPSRNWAIRSRLTGGETQRCSSNDQCSSGSYCANDGSCHPDSHRPIGLAACASDGGSQQFTNNTGGTNLEEMLAAGREERADEFAISYDSEEERLLSEARRELEACQARLAQLEQSATPEESTNTQTSSTSSTGDYEKAWGGVSGSSGTDSKEIDYMSYWIDGISWAEKENRPCHLSALSETAWNATGDTSAYVRLGNCTRPGDHKSVDLADGFIRKLQICTNKQSGRLKGIRIWGGRINENYPDSFSEQHNNCNDGWTQNESTCPDGMLASGLIVFSEKNANGDEWITGLELTCRPQRRPGRD